MKTVALVGLIVVAVLSVLGAMLYPVGEPALRIVQPILGIAIWSFLIWKFVKFPRRWSLWLGILLCGMFAFQTSLWFLGINNPTLAHLTVGHYILRFILDEIPIVVSAFCCLAIWVQLRRAHSRDIQSG